jgi:hypothetical protein
MGDGELAATKVVITELKRTGATVTLKFTRYNNGAAKFGIGSRFDVPGYKGNGPLVSAPKCPGVTDLLVVKPLLST